MNEVTVRRLTFDDLPQVMRIEQESFVAPWSLAMFLLEISKPDAVCLAAELEGELLGYLVCTRLDSVWHLMNVAVHPKSRRRRIASILIDAMFSQTGRVGPAQYTLEVRVSNGEAIQMYRAIGFQEAGLRRRYYANDGEDALIMWYTLNQRAAV